MNGESRLPRDLIFAMDSEYFLKDLEKKEIFKDLRSKCPPGVEFKLHVEDILKGLSKSIDLLHADIAVHPNEHYQRLLEVNMNTTHEARKMLHGLKHGTRDMKR